MRTRVSYSQNLLRNPKVAEFVLGKTTLTDQDIVVEIGPGNGIITSELLKICGKVIAIEIDTNLYMKLLDRYHDNQRLEILNQDFLEYPLPDFEYKVFSNIPFSSSSEIVRKLVFSENPPTDTYLFYQEEAAKHLYSRSLLAILIGMNFNVDIIHHFNSYDFVPEPNVSVVLLNIEKIEPRVPKEDQETFKDFVTYFYNQTKPNISESFGKVMGKEKINNFAQQKKFSYRIKPSELIIENWMDLFDYFLKNHSEFLAKIKGTYEQLQIQQSKLDKIHRTRKDLEWRNK